MSTQRMGFLASAERVLHEAGEPLHYREITRRALDAGWIVTQGKTPEATMNAQITTSLRRRGSRSQFVRTKPGVFALREWVAGGQIDEPDEAIGPTIFIPYFPIYEQTRAALPIWEGEPWSAITSTHGAIFALRGSPQEPQDWTEPDRWIEERLSGEVKRVALRTWFETDKRVNPRYMARDWRLATHHALVVESGGVIVLTEQGQSFVREPEGATVQEIDEREGLIKLLQLVAELGTARRSELLEPFGDFIRAESRLRSDAAIKATLWSRLRNLGARSLVARSGASYEITAAGLAYLERVGGEVAAGVDQQILELLARQKEEVREGIREILVDLDPYAFEHLIKRLLEEIGYEEVEVTARSGDKGVDVVGRIELGVTSVREVIQVKRQKTNVRRQVLDALRGVLFRFGAVRGTIITIGGFTRAARDAAVETGGSPVTLIDGDKLIDLLTQHQLGVKKKRAELWELDPEAFAGLLPDEAVSSEQSD